MKTHYLSVLIVTLAFNAHTMEQTERPNDAMDISMTDASNFMPPPSNSSLMDMQESEKYSPKQAVGVHTPLARLTCWGLGFISLKQALFSAQSVITPPSDNAPLWIYSFLTNRLRFKAQLSDMDQIYKHATRSSSIQPTIDPALVNAAVPELIRYMLSETVNTATGKTVFQEWKAQFKSRNIALEPHLKAMFRSQAPVKYLPFSELPIEVTQINPEILSNLFIKREPQRSQGGQKDDTRKVTLSNSSIEYLSEMEALRQDLMISIKWEKQVNEYKRKIQDLPLDDEIRTLPCITPSLLSQFNPVNIKEIQFFNVSYIADCLEKFPSLTKLTIDNSYDSKAKLACLPKSISRLTSLQTLHLRTLGLNSIPEISPLTQLEELSLRGNDFTTIPAEIINLPNLKILDFSYNDLSSFSWKGGIPRNLEVLKLASTRLKSFPSIEALMTLKSLDVSHNPLGKIPEEIEKLTTLRTLKINNTRIKDLSRVLKLSQLQHLFLANNDLEEISFSHALPHLEILDISGNKITQLNNSFTCLQNLQVLKCTDGILKEIEVDFSKFPHLRTIYLSNNKLDKISIRYLPCAHIKNESQSLSHLSIYGNPISDVSTALRKWLRGSYYTCLTVDQEMAKALTWYKQTNESTLLGNSLLDVSLPEDFGFLQEDSSLFDKEEESDSSSEEEEPDSITTTKEE